MVELTRALVAIPSRGGIDPYEPALEHVAAPGLLVHRAQLHVHGVASHSGGRAGTPSAIEKAVRLVRALSTVELPDGESPDFPLPGKLTVTALHGGQGYSVTPDLCTVNVDIRTTPRFDDRAATHGGAAGEGSTFADADLAVAGFVGRRAFLGRASAVLHVQ